MRLKLLAMEPNRIGVGSEERSNLSIGYRPREPAEMAERGTDSGHGFSCIGTISHDVLVIDDGNLGVQRHRRKGAPVRNGSLDPELVNRSPMAYIDLFPLEIHFAANCEYMRSYRDMHTVYVTR
jgi:hypothetical protein